jgi:hypothetical protein
MYVALQLKTQQFLYAKVLQFTLKVLNLTIAEMSRTQIGSTKLIANELSEVRRANLENLWFDCDMYYIY